METIKDLTKDLKLSYIRKNIQNILKLQNKPIKTMKNFLEKFYLTKEIKEEIME